jgi:hypothetical protein
MEDVMKRLLILTAVVCGLATVGASQSEAGRVRYRGYYSGGFYNAPYYGGGYYYGGYAPSYGYRSYYRGGWNGGWGRPGVFIRW